MNEPLQKSLHKQYSPLFSSPAKWLGGERLRLLLARVFYRLKVEGKVSIPPKGGCLVAFNHVSDIADTMVYLVIQHYRPDVYLFAWDLNREVVAGLMNTYEPSGAAERLLLTGLRPAQNTGELLRARQLLLEGGCVAIAPEGETSWDGRLQSPLAPGAAWLALQTASPIIPVVSRGGYDVQPLWRREKIHLTGRISVHLGASIQLCQAPLAHVKEAQLQEAGQSLYQAMADLLPNPAGKN
jgi:1-acyl-sn-glycerol-3-phosphate acyltransferase